MKKTKRMLTRKKETMKRKTMKRGRERKRKRKSIGGNKKTKMLPWVENHVHEMDLMQLSSNLNATVFLGERPDLIHWPSLSGNPNAIDILEANQDSIYWSSLSRNPNASELLENNIDDVDMLYLPQNTNAYRLIEANKHRFTHWAGLSANTCPDVIKLLEREPHNIFWCTLSANPSAVHLLKKNKDKIVWYN